MKQIIIAILLMFLASINLFAFSGNGSGKEIDPYQITTLLQLQEMLNELDAHYILMNNIDANDTKNWNNGTGFIAIGTIDSSFTGSFDGNGKVVKNLFINRPEINQLGLFGCIDSNYEIINLGVEDYDITGAAMLGGIAGYIISGTILNSYTTGSLSGRYKVGGLVGNNDGIVNNSYALGIITGGTKVGGLIGSNGGSISNSYSFVDIPSSGIGSGGLVGSNNGSINNSYAMGSVSGLNNIGGLVGSGGISATISNSYAMGSVSGNYSIGGLVGFYYGSITNSYAVGKVTGEPVVGGLVGESWGPVTACFWDIQTSGQSTSKKGTGKTTIEMKTKTTYTEAGWDFSDIWSINPVINNGYPYLQGMIPVSVEENSIQSKIKFNIYPNPAKEIITISMGDEITFISSIQIIDLSGRVVKEQYVDEGNYEVTLLTDNIPNGIYFLRIITNNRIFGHPFIIK